MESRITSGKGANRFGTPVPTRSQPSFKSVDGDPKRVLPSKMKDSPIEHGNPPTPNTPTSESNNIFGLFHKFSTSFHEQFHLPHYQSASYNYSTNAVTPLATTNTIATPSYYFPSSEHHPHHHHHPYNYYCCAADGRDGNVPSISSPIGYRHNDSFEDARTNTINSASTGTPISPVGTNRNGSSTSYTSTHLNSYNMTPNGHSSYLYY